MKNPQRILLGVILLALVSGAIVFNREIQERLSGLVAPYPKPRPGTGAVIGKLELAVLDNPAYGAGDLFLGRLIPASVPDAPPVVSFDYNSDPRTVVHEPNGTFAFTNVVPGNYALLIWTPAIGFVVEKPEGGLVVVVIEMDKTIDLGIIRLP